MRTITEGRATILLQGEDVFYNPAQVLYIFLCSFSVYRLEHMSRKRHNSMVRNALWVQVTNRDLSVAVLRHFVEVRSRELAQGKQKPKRHQKAGAPVPVPGQQSGKGVRVLEGLAASGLRAVRYALEVRVVLGLHFWATGRAGLAGYSLRTWQERCLCVSRRAGRVRACLMVGRPQAVCPWGSLQVSVVAPDKSCAEAAAGAKSLCARWCL